MIINILIIALTIRGIKIVTELLSKHWLGKDFGHLEEWAYAEKIEDDKKRKRLSKIRTTILKPLILCNICMSSIWGTTLYVLLTYPAIDIKEWLITIIAVAGLNQVINEI